MVEGVEFVDDDETVVVAVRPRRPAKRRCGQGERSWRALDLGTVKVVLRGAAPRVDCVEHGVTVAGVPWARHGSGVHLLVAGVTVGRMIARVVAERGRAWTPSRGLRRIGIDEVSHWGATTM